MRTYLRYNISVIAKEFPYKAPKEIVEASNSLYAKCKKYVECEQLKLVVIPIDVPEYQMIMEFKETYSEYASNLIIYEHKYTKKEMNQAEYFLIKSKALVIPKYSVTNMYGRCCDKNTLRGEEQKGYYIIGKNDMANKVITFTSGGRFFISNALKGKMEREGVTNCKFIPVYSSKLKEILAYQLEAEQLMPPLDDCNHWGIYKECPYCKRQIHNSVHEFPHPFMIPLSWKENLKDINATTEVFTETQCRHYVISRRVYELLLSMGAKKLICEPIIFV